MAIDTQLELSDEDFLKQDFSELEAQFDAEDTTDIDETVEEDTSTEDLNEDANQEIEASESNTESPEEDIAEEEVTDLEEDTLSEDEKSNDIFNEESQDTDVTADDTTTDTEGDTQENVDIDYEGAYKRIMAPFKASKRMMQIDDIDDAIKLMQMGADYSNKMKQIKPNLKVVSMLEKEGLLDESKINNLIDLSKKNPAAITQLLKESGIDPLDIDTDEEVDYKPTNYSLSDTEYEINQALDDIKDTPTFNKTLDVVGKQWDKESKDIVSKNPNVLKIINNHMQNGVYDKVIPLVERERMLGRLENVPDVVAYKHAAEYLQSIGELSGEGHDSAPNSYASVPKTKSKGDTAKLKQKRKAAGSTKKTTSNKTSSEPDYLKMTDEEFMKLSAIG